MDDNVAAVTVSVVEPLSVPKVAWIVVEPTATLVARPPAAIVALVVSLDDQVTVEVPEPVLLSE